MLKINVPFSSHNLEYLSNNLCNMINPQNGQIRDALESCLALEKLTRTVSQDFCSKITKSYIIILRCAVPCERHPVRMYLKLTVYVYMLMCTNEVFSIENMITESPLCH